MDIPSFVFTVPNNEEGRGFMKLFKKYLNKKAYKVVKRGRHPRRTEVMKMAGRRMNSQRDINLDLAETHVIYLQRKPTRTHQEFVDELSGRRH